MKKLIVLFLLFSATLAYSADTKTTALPENTTPAETDILMIVDDPGGTPASQKITKANLFKNITTESITPIKTSGVPGYSYWFEAETTNELFTGFQGPADLSVNISHVMPSSAGTVGQVFEIDTVQASQTLANGEIGTLVTLKNGDKGSATVTEQAADPTSASATGFYGATTSGDFFYKSDTGLYNFALGTYTLDPVLYTLTITDPGNNDYIQSTDGFIDCGNSATDCTYDYVSGATPELTATAASGRQFDNWTGDATDTSTTTNPDTITMDSAKGVSAVFSVTASYTINQNFETPTTGYDNGEVWLEVPDGGTIEPASTVNPLVGAQSCRMTASTGVSQRIQYEITPASAPLYLHFLRRIVSAPTTSMDLLTCLDSGVGVLFRLITNNALETFLSMPGGAEQSGPALTLGNVYHFWFAYVPGTGADARIDFYVGETTTRPASPTSSISIGTVTTDVTYLRIQCGDSGVTDVDQIIASSTEFTTVP